MPDYTALYIEHFLRDGEKMSEEDARTYMKILRGMPDEYSVGRIKNLVRYLDGIERGRAAEAEWERTWMAAAAEDKAIKERWESLGATWRGVGNTLTVWEYEGTEFYRWWSGVSVTDEIVKVREADERLAELINERTAA